MKYMLLFCGDAEYNQQWDSFPQEQKDEYMAQIGQWFGKHADKLEVTHQLESPSTAKTVRGSNGTRTVTDGPFIEAKEIIGGFAVFDVADEAEALQLAKEWPAGGTVEVRPVVPR
ncbi:MAG: YciI family protein [Candidatus Dormiibacterota bacterium]